MKKAIITGANGFIGKWLVKELVDNGIYVYAIVKDKTSKTDGIGSLKNVEIVYCDLKDILKLENIIADRTIDVFYHLAWVGSAGSLRSDTEVQLLNAQYTVDSVKVAKKIGCKKFIGAGSIMEEETIAAVRADGNKPGQAYIYGAGKLVAQCMSKCVAAEIGIDHIWAIITNAYGVGETAPRFINTTLRKVISDQPLQFTAATQNYDFIYISDLVKAFYYLGIKGKPFSSYVIGSAQAKPLKSFILQIQQTIESDKNVTFGDIPFTGINLPVEVFNCDRLENDTGFKNKVSFDEGIMKTMEWIKSQED